MVNPIVSYLIRNQFLTTLILLGFFWVAFELKEILIIIFISYIIMATLSPFSDFLDRKRVPRVLSVLIPYMLTITILVLLILPLVPFFTSQIQSLFKTLPTYINQTAKLLNIQIDISGINDIVASDIEALGKNALNVTGKIFNGVFSVLIVLVIGFYLMLERDTLRKQLAMLWPKKYQEKALKTVAQIENKLGLWFRGQLILSFTIGFSTWIALTLLGIPFALPLGLLAGMLEIIPTIGPIIASIPAIIVAFTISPTIAISVVIFYIVIQMLENNILVPKIMEKAVGLNPIVVIIGVLIGGKFLGILGALLAVPFIAMSIVILKSFKSS